MRFFFAGAANCEVDKQGRILLPANLREYAGIDKEVVSCRRIQPCGDLEQRTVSGKQRF